MQVRCCVGFASIGWMPTRTISCRHLCSRCCHIEIDSLRNIFKQVRTCLFVSGQESAFCQELTSLQFRLSQLAPHAADDLIQANLVPENAPSGTGSPSLNTRRSAMSATGSTASLSDLDNGDVASQSSFTAPVINITQPSDVNLPRTLRDLSEVHQFVLPMLVVIVFRRDRWSTLLLL